MIQHAPIAATAEEMRKLVTLCRSPELFLSIYLGTDPSQVTTEGTRLRVAALLDEVEKKVQGTSWEEPFQAERKGVEDYLRHLRPGGKKLVLLSSHQAQEWHALWLPNGVEEHARFGVGAYVLPLMDALDEFEPVGVALVTKDKARLIALSAARIEEVRRVESDVPGLHKQGKRVGAGYERHHIVHVEEHLKKAFQELQALYQLYHFRRLFVAGPDEARAMFKGHLTHEMSDRLVGEFHVGEYESDQHVRDLALARVREAERAQEKTLVEEIVTRAEKEQGAVVGLDRTLWALSRHEMHLLALASEVEQDGRYCAHCDLVLPLENMLCPQCDKVTLRVALWEELPGFALRHGVNLEVVHGEAASILWGYDGLGGILKPPAKR